MPPEFRELFEMNKKQEPAKVEIISEGDGGKIAGTWKSEDGSSKGTWQAQIDDHQWQFAHTPGLTGLYEYRNSKSGAYFYSTNEKTPDSDLQRTKNPVCRVWAVPTNLAAFDFNIKPDNID